MIIVSVSRRWVHGTTRGIKYRSNKKFWLLYYFDDEGYFTTRRINWYKAIYYKIYKWIQEYENFKYEYDPKDSE